MNKILLLLCAIFMAVSCRSDDESRVANYVGTWNWVSTFGGLSGIHETPENTGKTASITFTEDYHYTVRENNIVVNEGTFDLYKNISMNGYNHVFIDFSNMEDKAVEKIDDTDLVIFDDVADGLTYHYRKQ